jgi:hypothetical protein
VASIYERKGLVERYRVKFRIKGLKFFCLTFDDYDAACEWAKKHEKSYLIDPEYYHAWKIELFLKMQKKKLMVLNHITRPKFYHNN